MATSNGTPPRFFVSYRRRAEADARLAAIIVKRLRDQGCAVFIDVEMPVGIDWSQEIERRVAWCDFLVVLLSADSVASEMVTAEVRRAHHGGKTDGRSKILPVRVAYPGKLGYELDSYIGQLQYVLWRDTADDDLVVSEILRAITTVADFGGAVSPPHVASSPLGDRPDPKADMRLLRELIDAPGSALGSDNPFYLRRDADRQVEEFASGKARTVVIQAPSQMGKSSLLLRYLDRCMKAEKKVALIDLMHFGDVKNLSFATFAQQFVEILLRELDIQNVVLPPLPRVTDLTNFMHDVVLARLDGPVAIAIDDIDRVQRADWNQDFYAALRVWDSNRTNFRNKARWGRVGLALVISTEPTMLIESGYISPFNLTPPIVLTTFDRSGVETLNQSYRSILIGAQLDGLYNLLRGHPYLTPLAFYRMINDDVSFDLLLENAAKDDGPFGDHLRSRLARLSAAGLNGAMREVVLNSRVPTGDHRLYYRLNAAGLVRQEGDQVVASNKVYHDFFKAVL